MGRASVNLEYQFMISIMHVDESDGSIGTGLPWRYTSY
jgi:hypothetical protein